MGFPWFSNGFLGENVRFVSASPTVLGRANGGTTAPTLMENVAPRFAPKAWLLAELLFALFSL